MRFHIEIPTGAADALATSDQDAAEVITGHVRGLVREAVRATIRAQQTADRLALREAEAQAADDAVDGTVVAEEWVQPTGEHDAYEADAVVFHAGQFWVNTHGDGNVWEPGEAAESIWAPLGDDV